MLFCGRRNNAGGFVLPLQPFANSTTSVSDQHRMAAISTAVRVHGAVAGDGDCAGVIVSLISDTIHA